MSVAAATTVIAFSGGATASSARVAQANIDAVIDSALTISTGASGLGAVTPGRLSSDLPEVIVFAGADNMRAEGLDPNSVSFAVDEVAGALSAAASTDEGFCFYARILTNAGVDDRQASYGVVKAGSETPCSGLYAQELLRETTARGASWASPAVFG